MSHYTESFDSDNFFLVRGRTPQNGCIPVNAGNQCKEIYRLGGGWGGGGAPVVTSSLSSVPRKWPIL